MFQKPLKSIRMKTIMTTCCCLAMLSCVEGNNASTQKTDIPTIDLGKNYPEKTIQLEDIADVEYIPLETKDEVLVSRFQRAVVLDKQIILQNHMQGDVFIFDRKGKFQCSFNHKGNGPGEYMQILSFSVDPEAKEIFIQDHPAQKRIQVYSFAGKFKRTLPTNKQLTLGSIYNYDETYLFADWFAQVYDPENKSKLNDRPYLLIDKQTGELKPLPLKIKNQETGRHRVKKGNGSKTLKFPVCRVMQAGDVVISDYGLDTTCIFANGKMTPLLVRNVAEQKKKGEVILSTILAKSDRYVIVDNLNKQEQVEKIMNGAKEAESTQLLCDMKKGTIHDSKLRLSTMPDQDITINNFILFEDANQMLLNVGSNDELIDLYDDNKLKGRLKEITSKLKMDDNPVLVLATFKD